MAALCPTSAYGPTAWAYRGEGDRRLAGRRAESIEGPDQLLTAQRQGEEIQHSRFLGAQHQAHGRRLDGGDQAGAARCRAQRVDPPGQVVVRVLAQHRHHDVPAATGQLSHGARQIGRRIHLELSVVRPLP